MPLLDLSKYSPTEIITLYSSSIKELKRRGIIRTNNVLGDLGEYLAIEYYKNTKGLPKLQPAPVGTKSIDAISVNGERYTIKSTTVNTTGAFYGLEPPESSTPDRQIFEYVVVVRFSKNMELEDIYEIDWPTFIKHKHWHSRIRAWNLILSKALIEDSKIVFHNDKAQND